MAAETYGNAYRINGLDRLSGGAVLCIHDARHAGECAELERALSQDCPFGYIGTSPWLGSTCNRLGIDIASPLNLLISSIFFDQTKVSAVIYLLDDCAGLGDYLAFCSACLSGAVHIAIDGEAVIRIARLASLPIAAVGSIKEAAEVCRRIAVPSVRTVEGSSDREWAEWAVFSFSEKSSASGRLLFVGDSISYGYRSCLDELLPEYSMDFFHTSEGTTNLYNLFRALDIMLSKNRYDAIHINIGIHLHGVSTAEYRDALSHIFSHIRNMSPGAKLIFATTTTVSKLPSERGAASGKTFSYGDRRPLTDEDCLYTEYDARASAVYRKLNRAAISVCRKEGVVTDDLCSVSLDNALPKRDPFHFGQAGYRILAGSVAESVRRALAPGR